MRRFEGVFIRPLQMGMLKRESQLVVHIITRNVVVNSGGGAAGYARDV